MNTIARDRKQVCKNCCIGRNNIVCIITWEYKAPTEVSTNVSTSTVHSLHGLVTATSPCLRIVHNQLSFLPQYSTELVS
jgi:hypothetical protein